MKRVSRIGFVAAVVASGAGSLALAASPGPATFAPTSLAATAGVSGQAFNQVGMPASGAAVTLYNYYTWAILAQQNTGEKGTFNLGTFEPGHYYLAVNFVGYDIGPTVVIEIEIEKEVNHFVIYENGAES